MAAAVGMFFGLTARERRITRLLEEFRSSEVAVRRRAAQALAEEPPPHEAVRQAFGAGLTDSDAEVRRWSCRGLGSFGAPADRPALEPLLGDPQTPVRRGAAFAVLRLDPHHAGAQKELTDAMRAGDGGVILALTNWTPPPAWATPTLIGLLKDRRPGIRRLAADALGQVGPTAPPPAKTTAETALRSAAKDSDSRVRESVQKALQHWPAAEKAPERSSL